MKNDLIEIANALRISVIEMLYNAGSGHPGGSLSAAEIITALYFDVMDIDPKNPHKPDRDRFILSKGHACPIQYAALAKKGYFPQSDLMTLRKYDSHLQGHPDSQKTPGIDISTGSLGQGLSIGLGMALSAKVRSLNYSVFVVLGDGEIQEGAVWEAAMAASFHKADNLIAILDNNGIQLEGNTRDIMDLGNIEEKWRSFGWCTEVVDGHDVYKLAEILRHYKETRNGKPGVIIANTIKGKGVSFMEGRHSWHGATIGEKEYKMAMQELGEHV